MTPPGNYAQHRERLAGPYPLTPQRPEYHCEWCDGEAPPDDRNYVAQALVCPNCIEDLIAHHKLEAQP